MEAAGNLHEFHQFPDKASRRVATPFATDWPTERGYGLELMTERGTGCGP